MEGGRRGRKGREGTLLLDAPHLSSSTLEEQCVKCALLVQLTPDWPCFVRDVLTDNPVRQIPGTSEILVKG